MSRFFVSSGVAFISLIYASLCWAGSTSATFRFESIETLDEMSSFIHHQFPLGSSRDNLRRVFVTEGRATLKIHPQYVGVEKYIYDINLCKLYVWRWNISADYDADGMLQQVYLNGDIVFPNGKPKKIISKVAEAGNKAAIYRAQRPRPEASKGERSLGFILFDRDSNLKTKFDQAVAGVGPSRADPMNMGKVVGYADVEPWRSIFDNDAADHIVPYQGDCTTVDKLIRDRKAQRAK